MPPPEENKKKEMYGIEDIMAITGHSDKTASKIMNETGFPFILHRKKFVLREDFLAYLRKKAGHDD